MKISIITATLNSEKTIRDTLNSVYSQNYKNFEHIIVDGGSTDKTINLIKKYIKNSKNTKLYIKKNMKLYSSINYGIKKSIGEYIFLLHSDDIFNSNNILQTIIEKIYKYKKYKIFLGNIIYFKNKNYSNPKRIFKSNNFKNYHLRLGLMPPHTGSIIHREIYENYGYYRSDFKTASDFEFFLRVLYIHKIKYKKIDHFICRMRLGGLSGKNLMSYIISTIEINKSLKINNLNSNIILIFTRLFIKAYQLIISLNRKHNKNFNIFDIRIFKEYYEQNSFKIFSSIKKISFEKNIILSGMNLAFLGYFSKKILYPHKDLFNWPDGIWTKNIINVKKISGSEMLNHIKLPKNIKQINIMGNLSERSKRFLKKKFKKKIFHQNLPYGNIKKILYKKFFLKKNELTLITLPTPKQELIAYELAKYNKFYKIICIGASVAIASGDEKQVPVFLKSLEFLWRLRSDTFRRINRMFETFYYYCKGKYIKNLYNKTYFFKID